MRGWPSSGMRRARSAAPDDLAAIRTLGFRGEALPSIASVSHFVLRTRARGQQSGTEIRVNGGTVASVVEVGAAEGTVVEVNDLFYNLPARRKFLKSDGAEVGAGLAHRHAARAGVSGGRLHADERRPHGAAVSAGRVAARSAVSAVRRARRSARGRKERRRPAPHRLHRGAGRSGADARPAARLHQPPHRQGPDDRARDHRRLQPGVDQGAQPGGASVHRDGARRGRRQRPSDEGRGPVPRSVARARGGAAGADGRAGAGRRAAAAAAAGDRRAVAGRRGDSRHPRRRRVSEPVGARRRLPAGLPTPAEPRLPADGRSVRLPFGGPQGR